MKVNKILIALCACTVLSMGTFTAFAAEGGPGALVDSVPATTITETAQKATTEKEKTEGTTETAIEISIPATFSIDAKTLPHGAFPATEIKENAVQMNKEVIK